MQYIQENNIFFVNDDRTKNELSVVIVESTLRWILKSYHSIESGSTWYYIFMCGLPKMDFSFASLVKWISYCSLSLCVCILYEHCIHALQAFCMVIPRHIFFVIKMSRGFLCFLIIFGLHWFWDTQKFSQHVLVCDVFEAHCLIKEVHEIAEVDNILWLREHVKVIKNFVAKIFCFEVLKFVMLV